MTKHNKLSARIAQMTTEMIKNTLHTMNLKPVQNWTDDELLVENALILELCNRNEDEWVLAFENQIG